MTDDKLLVEYYWYFDWGLFLPLDWSLLITTVHQLVASSYVHFRLVSLLVLLFEAPICCQFFNYAKALSDFADRRSYMQKALIYVGSVIIHLY